MCKILWSSQFSNNKAQPSCPLTVTLNIPHISNDSENGLHSSPPGERFSFALLHLEYSFVVLALETLSSASHYLSLKLPHNWRQMILFSLFLPFFWIFVFHCGLIFFSLSYNRWKPNAHSAKSNAVRTSQGGKWEKLDLWDDNYVIGYYRNDSHRFCMEAGAGGSQRGAERGCLFSPLLPGDCGLSSCLKSWCLGPWLNMGVYFGSWSSQFWPCIYFRAIC